MESDPTPSVDGITPVQKQSAPAETGNAGKSAVDEKSKRLMFLIVLGAGIPYGLYVLWSLFLLAVLPDASGAMDSLIPAGKLVALLMGGVLVAIAGFGVMRIAGKSDAPQSVRIMGMVRVAAFVLPGLILSVMVPLIIAGEPNLPMRVVDPDPTSELVAPLEVTFSVEEAVAILARRGLNAQTFSWDFNQDGVTDEETIIPIATAVFDRQGLYYVSVSMLLSDGSRRNVGAQLRIPRAVFSYSPMILYVNEPIVFSVEHLLTEEALPLLKQISWDFNGDGIPDEEGTALSTSHTFLSTGEATVSVTILLTNQSKTTYERTLTINEPLPQPFPVYIETIPNFLVSSPPFQALFTVRTDEPYLNVEWDFGDGTVVEGERAGHTFNDRGVFKVTATVRSQAGELSKASQIVKIVKELDIPDLSFEGSHIVGNNKQIVAEVPVTVELKPVTKYPLIDFFWEAPKATEVQMPGTSVIATYREEGTYSLVLVAQDPEGAILRLPITVIVEPRSSYVSFDMQPQQGVAPLTVQFDASESFVPNQTITGFVWDFDDQNAQGAQRLDSAKVEHMFEKPGNYRVTLKVFTTTGEEFDAEKTIVVRMPVLDACFMASRTDGNAPLGVRFNRECTAGTPVSVLWDFDDGSQSDSLDAVIDHVFEEAKKVFNVKLTVEDNGGTMSTFSKTIRTY